MAQLQDCTVVSSLMSTTCVVDTLKLAAQLPTLSMALQLAAQLPTLSVALELAAQLSTLSAGRRNFRR
eukprot:11079634-Alexandrium_andersonii.AAC.1